MPLTDEELARKIVASNGGTWATPDVQEIETRQPEVINETPLIDDKFVYYLPRLTTPPLTVLSTPPLAVSSSSLVAFARRIWMAKVWVPEREEYDAEANVLKLYGHWRVHRFTVWVKEGDDA